MRNILIISIITSAVCGFTFKLNQGPALRTSIDNNSPDKFKKELKSLLDKNNFRGFAAKYKEAVKKYPSESEWLKLRYEFIVKDYQNSVLKDTWPKGVSMYITAPGINCQEGKLTKLAENRLLARLNYYRRLAGVDDSCILNTDLNIKAQKAAHFMHVNNILTHTPKANMKCYDKQVDEAARKSNLSLGYGFIEALNGQMAENEGSNAAVGHRRWILNPKNTVFGFGSTDKSMCLYVIDTKKEAGYGTGDGMHRDTNFIAWPSAGYFPKNLIYRRWSFSLDNADFSNAQVSLTLNGKSIKVTKEKPEIGYAINTLVWNVDAEIQAGKTYTVKITRVMAPQYGTGKPVSKTFTYSITPCAISL